MSTVLDQLRALPCDLNIAFLESLNHRNKFSVPKAFSTWRRLVLPSISGASWFEVFEFPLASLELRGSPDVPPTGLRLLGGARGSWASSRANWPNGLTCWRGVRCGGPSLPVTLATSQCPSSLHPNLRDSRTGSNGNTATHLVMSNWPSSRSALEGAKHLAHHQPLGRLNRIWCSCEIVLRDLWTHSGAGTPSPIQIRADGCSRCATLSKTSQMAGRTLVFFKNFVFTTCARRTVWGRGMTSPCTPSFGGIECVSPKSSSHTSQWAPWNMRTNGKTSQPDEHGSSGNEVIRSNPIDPSHCREGV